MCDQDEKQKGNEGYESFHANSINAVWPKRLTRNILPHACVGGQKSEALENKVFPLIALQLQSQEMPLVGDKEGERWCSKSFIHRSNVRVGHFSVGAGGGAEATQSGLSLSLMSITTRSMGRSVWGEERWDAELISGRHHVITMRRFLSVLPMPGLNVLVGSSSS